MWVDEVRGSDKTRVLAYSVRGKDEIESCGIVGGASVFRGTLAVALMAAGSGEAGRAEAMRAWAWRGWQGMVRR
jgi:hypothetical protein